jgi:hypothetical protein
MNRLQQRTIVFSQNGKIRKIQDDFLSPQKPNQAATVSSAAAASSVLGSSFSLRDLWDLQVLAGE